MSNQAERNSVVQHTPEPWAMSTRVDGNWWHISAGNQAIAAVHAASKKRNEPYASMFEANARRIVACVNACAGIDTESLEADGYGDNWAEIAKHRIELIGQRDELLVALQAMVLFTAPNKSNAAALSNALQVIAKAKGSTE